MEMWEKIARAAYEKNREQMAPFAEAELCLWDDAPSGLHDRWLANADAVLAAMREPEPRMVAAALPLIEHPTDEQRTIAKAALALLPPVRIEQHVMGEQAAADLVRDWQTMIDAARP